ncbi:hypothetical protein TI05_09025 [Achromatium sp. WMS3]|nr:hypothetical protein TI05_09025 [Achromatium sp. WMS3]
MIVIEDSSALIALSICNCLPILEPLFGEIQVPIAVFKEVCIPGKPEAEILRTWLGSRVGCGPKVSDMIYYIDINNQQKI